MADRLEQLIEMECADALLDSGVSVPLKRWKLPWLKRPVEVLDKLGVTPSDILRQTLEYVASQGRSPFRTTVVTEDEEVLLAIVRERLASPQKGIKVSLDDL
jgi:RHH-type rel operon transcriptional repressor/antitoxin RelB